MTTYLRALVERIALCDKYQLRTPGPRVRGNSAAHYCVERSNHLAMTDPSKPGLALAIWYETSGTVPSLLRAEGFSTGLLASVTGI